MSGRAAYLDASAIVKLAIEEAESDALRRWIAGRTHVTSLVGVAEAIRAFRRRLESRERGVVAVLDRMERLPLGEDVVTLAALLDPPALRTLDAIHLASALALEDTLGSFVTYDRRLAAAARTAGLRVASPGAA